MLFRVKKKGAIATFLAVVVVILIGYLAALSYSSHMFSRYLDRELRILNRTTGIHWQQTVVSRGLFSSSLRVVGEFSAQSDAPLSKVTLPLIVHHGVFHTTLEGRVVPQWRSSPPVSQYAFAHLFAGYPSPTFHASINSLTRTVSGEVQAADFHPTLIDHSVTLDVTGIRLPFTMEGEHLIYDLRWHSLQWRNGQHAYQVGAGHDRVDRTLSALNSRSLHDLPDQEHTANATDFYQEKVEIGRISLIGFLPLPLFSRDVSLDNLCFQGNASQQNGQLSYHISASIGRAETSGKTLGSLKLDETLDHIDMSALARFFGSVNALSNQPSALYRSNAVNLPAQLPSSQPSNARSISLLLQQTWPNIRAILAGSPRLHINQLTLTTPFFDQPLILSGLINIDGRSGVPASYEDARSDAGVAWWRQHLHGDLDVLHAPASLSILSGSDENNDDINLVISHGELKVNDQRFLSLF